MHADLRYRPGGAGLYEGACASGDEACASSKRHTPLHPAETVLTTYNTRNRILSYKIMLACYKT